MASGHRSDLENYVPPVRLSKTKGDKKKERLEGISNELKTIERRQKDNFRQGQKPIKKRDLSETAEFMDEQLDTVLGAIRSGDLMVEDEEEHADRLKGKLPKFSNLPDFIIETLGLAL
jgi:hypothetical protein